MDNYDYKNSPEGRKAAAKYADIIHLNRPVSNRPHMDLVQRAKIFSPYDALRGFDEAIDETAAQGRRVQKILLSDEESTALSDKLLQARKGMRLSAKFFVADPDGMGIYRTAEGIITGIDPVGQILTLEERQPDTTAGKLEKVLPTVIRFDDLLDIEYHSRLQCSQNI